MLMVIARERVEDGVAEVVREEGTNGSEPKVGTNETLNVESNSHTQAKSRQRHGVAEARTRSRRTRMEEEQNEDDTGGHISGVVSLHPRVHNGVHLDPEHEVEDTKDEARDGINVRVSSEIHARDEHGARVPRHTHHQEHSCLRSGQLGPEPPREEERHGYGIHSVSARHSKIFVLVMRPERRRRRSRKREQVLQAISNGSS